MNLAFIGIGNMGLPMARNLLRAGHSVSVYNRSRERAEALRAEGARIAESPADAAKGTDALATMLADDRAVEEMVFDSGLAGSLGSTIHIGMSTISVALSKRLAEVHGAADEAYLAAPVFGRPEAAAAQKLWVVAAGASDVLERCRPVLVAVGRGITVVGEQPWLANVVKVSGNFMITSVLEAMGEAFALVRKSGIPARQFLEIVNTALFNSPLYANYGGLIADERYEPAGFRLRLGLKDTRLVLEAADSAAVPMPLAGLIRDNFLNAVAHGRGDIDWSGIATVAAENAGLDSGR